MIKKADFPILEYDSKKKAIINPDLFAEKIGKVNCDKLIVTFFGEEIKRLLSVGEIEQIKFLPGETPNTVYKFVNDDVMIMQGIVGCPATCGQLEEVIALGAKKIVFCGGGGVLERDITVGKFFVVDGAIRDEGFSYHYCPPSRIIYTDEGVKNRIISFLTEQKIPFIQGITWTTDAFYRETEDMIKYRKEEGAKMVEMEQAGCIAVCKFRNVKYGAILYAGDDVSGKEWDNRDWAQRYGIRSFLLKTCKDIVKQL
ncbi:MAG: nucleoside phosphorylase [Clostridia bacterium]|nr:nucleoside phosphorylase [Clostridia bacterium]